MTTEAAVTTDPKIYTAAEVASAWFSKEEIDQALATVTQKSYEAAKSGKNFFLYYGTNRNFLNEIASHLEELGYTTKLSARATGNNYITVLWDADQTHQEEKE